MKRRKVRQLVSDVLEARDVMTDRPVSFDTLVIDFANRRVTVRGRSFTTDHDAVTIPLLSTDRVVVTTDSGLVI